MGVEISNAYYPKYQARYEKMGLEKRKLVKGAKVHGKTLEPFMDCYDVQITALKALWKAIHEAHGVPYECPLDESGEQLLTSSDEVASAKFKGFL